MTVPRQIQLRLISDFNTANFDALLKNDKANPGIEVHSAPFGQVKQQLLLEEGWEATESAIVWTRPESAIDEFRKIKEYESVDEEQLLAAVDGYAAALIAASTRVRFLFIPTWVMSPHRRMYSLLDWRENLGVTRALQNMNIRLAKKLDLLPNVVMMNAQVWVDRAGETAFSEKMWYLSKTPYTQGVFRQAVNDVKSCLRGLLGESRKLVILDLDDTLWAGIVGDVGWENLILGGHDAVGEALVDFQRELKAMTRRGVLLAVVSKNDERIALEAIRLHPEMVLRVEDFAGWRINWQDKAENIVSLVSEMNLGLQSVVFIDDNPAERSRIREALPEVLVPEWPMEKTSYPQAFRMLDCFNVAAVTDGDAKRTDLYLVERERDSLRRSLPTLIEWLQSLQMKVVVEPLTKGNLPRAVQLLNKTNQMNLSTRRLSEKEAWDWAQNPGRRFWTISIVDRFGDLGLTGILSVEEDASELHVVDFVLSCRVMGRRVEEIMLHCAVTYSCRRGLELLRAKFVPTLKNKPCLEWLQKCGLSEIVPNNFIWKMIREFPLPEGIQAEFREDFRGGDS